ncbi:Hpt domain-containing protein [Pseudoduganella namucuonensis]|uniref:Chemotaxis protein CheA n=1 Tax=Pseudoduganella namucuonensis TaxID=1035707 RepID=A0A1I7LJ65_9BURK|nr:Hpt domain-containing protein [Pseudoduganella namucuonensis]SFV09715.1 chemosensory pili system protein ChpA (sensor histidine kinase/response regulator) [Pseudoduganella namucuonensis]
MTKPDFPATPQFDTGPLSWVMVEIREALGRSKTALFEAGGRDPEDQATALQHAKSHLHQAHGALQIVDVDGVPLVTRLAEEALDRFKAGTLKCSTDNAQTVANLYQAVIEFLEELLAGAPLQPVRLFPYYRAIQEMLGVERVHPADLFFPDLGHQARVPSAAHDAAPDYPAYRQRFERALLPYLKSADAAAQAVHAAALRDAVTLVADAQREPGARTFWLAMQAFAELVAAGELEGGLYVKQLFGLINLQMRRLTQGVTDLPQVMLRDALFFIAGADNDDVSPLAHHLCSVFALDGMVPADYEAKRYGQIDAAALARAKEAIADAKSAWERLSEAIIDPALDERFAQALAAVAASCDKLGMAALATLMRQLAQVAKAAVNTGRGEALSLEMTTALLFGEHGLEQIRHLPDDFSAHADTIGARLQALLAGATPPAPAQWQGGIARQMRQDDTVVALALEMKTGLRQVEKVLDDYYGDPSLRPSLRELDGVLHQLHGALAILDQDDAARAAQHVRREVADLAAGRDDPSQEPRVLDEIAQNVGALGFFVDMLAQNAAGARERFAFNEEQGAFRAVPFKKIAAAGPVPLLDQEVASPTSPPTPEPEPEQAVSSDAAIEAELLEIFIAEAQEVLVFVRETLLKPRDVAGGQDNLTMLRRSFHTLKGSGRMVGLNQFADAAAGIERTMNVWLAEERPANEALFGLLERASGDLSAWVEELIVNGVSARTSDALTAAAVRVQEGGLFDMLEDGGAVSATGTAADEAAAGEAVAEETIAAKSAAGEAVVEEAITAEPVTEEAADAETAPDQSLPDVEVSAAADAATGPETERAAAGEAVAEDLEFAPALSHAGGNVIDFPSNVAPLVPPEDDNIKHIGALSIPLPLYNIYLAETDELVRLLTRDFGEWRHEPRRPVAPEALQAAHTLAGTSATVGFRSLRDLAHALELALETLRPPAPQLDQAQHDLLDFAIERIRQMLQSFALGEVAPEQPELIGALGQLREDLAKPRGTGTEFDARMDALFADTFHSIVGNAPPAEVEVLAEPFDAHSDAAGAPASAPAPIEAPASEGELADRLEALFAAAYQELSGHPAPASDFAGSAPVAKPSAPRAATPSANDDIDDLFDAAPRAAKPSASDDIDDLFDSAFDDAFAAPRSTMAEPSPDQAVAAAELLAFAAPESGAEQPLEPAPPPAEATPAPVPSSEAEAEPESLPALESQPQAEPEPVAAVEQEPALEDQLLSLAELEPEPPALAVLAPEDAPAVLQPAAVAPPPPEPEPDVRVLTLPDAPAELASITPGSYTDELDPDLLPVFLEEGADLMPQIGKALRTWQRNPTDFSHAHMLQRVLHTVKGSARMAGAMRLGQHAHEIETHIENMVHANSATPQAFEELLTHYDHALLLFERLQHPVPDTAPQEFASAPAEATGAGHAAPSPDGAAPASAPASAPAARPAIPAAGDEEGSARAPLVRVRADILDRLVNQAGEVSISRSRLENEVANLRTSLADFSDNLAKLRRQLREVEMQAESQIASRMAISSEREFDPLEFDRFTRLQELTRMMAESVNDVASFHESLTRSVDGASGDLVQQARMTRDLQRDLMRVRMVPFASISERLFRVARLSAKELDKRVNLDIRGGAVEIDRGVLERMAAPFEHMLRNAIVHGVETRAMRSLAGKDETGELLVQVSQQGNEVVIEFSDDGAGLDLDRIRDKARHIGILVEGEDLSDAEAADLIFEPGFSTADTLTEQAGRGVGMDVVRSEAQALGGRVETATERGKGARFTIRLPLTLAVTQVVLIAAAGRSYALPSTLVEQVLQMKEAALADARGKGHVALQDVRAPLDYLPTMLGDAAAHPPAQRSAPVLMLRSGAERLALQVDEIIGNREVVIKNIGPQLARMPGIAGATVLGSGEIVLILQPLALAQHLAQHPELRVAPAEAAQAAGQPAAPRIMVVDDSLTVRKVTQRLLEREGYQVILAKDGVDALEQMQDTRPDLMLVDIEMPRMDGFDLTRNVRGDERGKDIPIIMITSRSADKHRNYAMQLGVNAYFGKPFQEPVLLGAIQGLLADR